MATLANLVVRITGNTTSLNRAVDRAETRMGRFKRGAGKALKAVQTAAKGLAVAGGVAIAGFAVGAIKNFADLGDELDKMSQRTGFSVEALGELKFAAEQSGASLDTVEKASKRMATTILDASMGLSTATDSLDAIGLSVEQLQGLSPEQQFETIATALAQVDDASQKAALAQRIFGKSGTELLPLFAQGADGMAALRQQAQDLGVVMSGDAAKAAADFKDAQNELKSALSGVFLELGSQIVPAMTGFIRLLVDKKPQIIAFFTDIKQSTKPFFEAFLSGLGVIFPLIRTFFQFIFDNKPILIAAIAAIGLAIFTALGPVSQAIIAITGIITAIGFLRDNWDTIWGAVLGVLHRVRDTFNNIFDHIKAVVRSVADFIMPIIDNIRGALSAVSGAVSTVGSVARSVGGFIPGLAEGGTIRRPGAALVGERGPELVSLPRGASVAPLDGSTGLTGGTTVNIYTLPAADWRREVERIVNAPGARARAAGRA